MRRLEFLEMLAKGEISKPGEFDNMAMQKIPDYPFADLLAPVETDRKFNVPKKRYTRHNFPLLKIGQVAMIKIATELPETLYPTHVVWGWYKTRKMKVSVSLKDGFVHAKRIA